MSDEIKFDSYLRKIEELQREVCDLKKRLTETERHVTPGPEVITGGHGQMEIAPRYSDRIRFRRINMRRVGYRAVVNPLDFTDLVQGGLNEHLDVIPADTLDYFRYLSRMGHEWGPLTIHTNAVSISGEATQDRMWRIDGIKRAVYFVSVRGLDKIPIQIFPSTTDDELLPASEEQLERLKEYGIYASNGEKTLTLNDVSIVL